MDSTLDAEPKGSGLLRTCVSCCLPLPLRLPNDVEKGQKWQCNGCGSTYYAVLDTSEPADKLRRNVNFVATEASSTENLAASGYKPRGQARAALPARPKMSCAAETPLSRALDSTIDNASVPRTERQGVPFAEHIREPGATGYEKETITRFVRGVQASSEQVEELFSNLSGRNLPRLERTTSVSENALVQMAEDLDLFVSLGINPPDGSYPSQHALHVGMLAMAIGCRVGWDRSTLIDLGIGCLIHDFGMLGGKNTLFEESRELSGQEYIEIVRHPLRTFDMIERQLDKVPLISRIVAYQMHERCNGEGYPRGRTSRHIHDLAKVAAVADVFVALVSARPHRPAMLPYYAVKHLLEGVAAGLFSAAAVRALLRTVSLFPLGSRVALSDGRVGTVIRSSEQRYDRPVLELTTPENELFEPVLLDLSQDTSVSIQKPLVG